jgi:hypothetical protein
VRSPPTTETRPGGEDGRRRRGQGSKSLSYLLPRAVRPKSHPGPGPPRRHASPASPGAVLARQPRLCRKSSAAEPLNRADRLVWAQADRWAERTRHGRGCGGNRATHRMTVGVDQVPTIGGEEGARRRALRLEADAETRGLVSETRKGYNPVTCAGRNASARGWFPGSSASLRTRARRRRPHASRLLFRRIRPSRHTRMSQGAWRGRPLVAGGRAPLPDGRRRLASEGETTWTGGKTTATRWRNSSDAGGPRRWFPGFWVSPMSGE